ncbi:MAG: acyl-CoA dehydrogenase C-terminal domain-containing protein, partial [Chromatiales bacterium]|nr:acyl-CoA dehydrogenase C-terminal domain-containing protein [Chromatiales bacterium]
TDYLRIFALTTLAYFWAQMVQVAQSKLDGEESSFYQTKINTARFFMGRLLPQTQGLAAGIRSGAELMMAFEEEAF